MNVLHALALTALICSASVNEARAQPATAAETAGSQASDQRTEAALRLCLVRLRVAQAGPLAILPRSTAYDTYLDRCHWMIEATRLLVAYENLQAVRAAGQVAMGRSPAAQAPQPRAPVEGEP